MLARVLSAVLAWGIAEASPQGRTGRPRVLLWPVSPALASELPPTIDPRFEAADRGAFEAELAGAQSAALDGVRTRLAAVEVALANARDHYVAQRWDDMAAALARIERDELALLADPRRCDVLWEVEFRLGLVGRGRHDPAQTRRRNLLALALAPARRPVREVYGPAVVAEFLDAVDARAGQVAVPVRLDVAPGDAVVHVDCQPVRGTHVDLPPGLHVVHARALGHTTAAALFEVPERTAVEVALAPEATDDGVARLGHGLADGALVLELPPHRRALVEAAAARNIDVVVAIESAGEAVVARALVGAARGPAIRRASVELAIAAVLAGVADDGALRATGAATVRPRPVADDRTTRTRPPIVRAWWLWTTIAIVVGASLGVGLGVGLRDRSSDRIVVYGPR
jgi:hypothetical protein